MREAKERCQRLATHLRVWPGREPDYVCDDHAEDSREIMRVLGHPDVCVPCPTEEPCACTPGRLQRVNVGPPEEGGVDAD